MKTLALAGLSALAGAASIAAAPAAALEQKLIAPDGAASDLLGIDIAIEGDTLVAGASGDDAGRGAVYVFQRSGDTWTNTAKLTASDGAAGDSLGTSVAIEGDTIVAGASSDDIGLNGAQGSVYTFARTGGAVRTETAKLTASDGVAGDLLGASVAIEGDTIVAGASREDADRGSLYTFARTGPAARTETAKLIALDGAAGDLLGRSVAIDGDTIVGGAYRADVDAKAEQGAVYTFARTGTAVRTETAKLTATDGEADDRLGYSVAIQGDTVVAGAYQDAFGPGLYQGSVYTFARTGATARTETAKLTASDGAAGDELGTSVAIDGDTILAGAQGDDFGAGIFQGSAYTFARTGTAARTENGKLSASDGAPGDGLGLSAAIDGDTIAAGAWRDDVGSSTNQGSVLVLFEPQPQPPADTTPPETSAIRGKEKVKRGKKPKYRFSSNEAGSTFECRVDKKSFKPCEPPYRLRTKKLKPGKHGLRVRAIDAAGNVDPTPAVRKVRVKRARKR